MNSLIQWSKKTIKVLLLFVIRTLMFSPFFFAANSGKQFLTTLCPNEKGNLFNDRWMDGWMDVEKSFTNLLTKRKGKERNKKKIFFSCLEIFHFLLFPLSSSLPLPQPCLKALYILWRFLQDLQF